MNLDHVKESSKARLNSDLLSLGPRPSLQTTLPEASSRPLQSSRSQMETARTVLFLLRAVLSLSSTICHLS